MFRVGPQPGEPSVSAAVTLMAVGRSISGPKAVPPGLSGSASHLPLWASALFPLDFLVSLLCSFPTSAILKKIPSGVI